MANKLQKMLFNLSTISPILFFACIVWWIQRGAKEVLAKDGTICLTEKAIFISVIGILGLFYAFYSVLIVKTGCRKLEIVPISVNSVKSNDKYSVVAIISYVLPFSNLVLADYNIWLSLSIIGIALLFLFISNVVWPNPILMLCKYHFYEILTANGSNGLSLISTRKSIQDAKTIKKVIALWDYFMIEVKQ
ncbi:MAG: hypothetical protein K6F76_05905 [Clostridiales bacterium]|nr:hypothetical protein [Clostridiales bacterium]